MVVTRGGVVGVGVVGHVVAEGNIVIVHAPIPRLQTVGKTAADWDELQNHRTAIHSDAQVTLS